MSMLRLALVALFLLCDVDVVAQTGNSAGSTHPAAAVACRLRPADAAWLDDAVAAWRYAEHAITHITPPRGTTAIIFDERCVLFSDDAMGGSGAVHWRGAPIVAGAFRTPKGREIPAKGALSYAEPDGDRSFYVMSVPSLWRAAGVPGGPLGLERLMIAVMLHEGTHVSQGSTYMAAIGVLGERLKLPEDFNDDSIQNRFKADAAFASSVQQETDLLYRAAAAPDRVQARSLATQALELMDARRARSFVGADAGLGEVEDVFLTLEGSGQYAGYRWLLDPAGGRATPAATMDGFALRGGWWTQTEGLAILLALDRVAGPAWRAQVFVQGRDSGTALLRTALRAGDAS